MKQHKPTLNTIRATPPINETDHDHQQALLGAVEATLSVPMLTEDDDTGAITPSVFSAGWNAALDAVRQAFAHTLTLPGVDVQEPTPAELARDSAEGTVLRVTGWADLEPLVFELEPGGWWASMDGVRTKKERLAEMWAGDPAISVKVLFDPERESRPVWT